MALRYICAIAVLLGSVLATTHELSGVIARAPACTPGQPCPTPPPTAGKKEEIWHCDGTCTNVYLRCHLDRFEVSFEPPAGSKNTNPFALGGPGHDGKYAIQGCDSGIYGPPGGKRPSLDGPFGSPIHEVISYDRCGTVSTDSTDPEHPHCREYHNSLLLIEYLYALPASSLNAAIHVVSNTTLNIKCCSCGSETNTTCPEPPLKKFELDDCTNKTFALTCNSIEETERYCCSLDLAAGQTLPSGVGFHPKNCYGVDVDGTKAEVSLLAPPSDPLQVTLSGSSSTGFTFGGPWFQFDRSPIVPHRVEVRCDVELSDTPNVPSYPGPSCPLPSRPRSDAGFFQAGQLTLIK